MSYLDADPRESANPTEFGFQVKPTERGWRWVAYDQLGRVSDEGEALTRAEAAALVIRALSRT